MKHLFALSLILLFNPFTFAQKISNRYKENEIKKIQSSEVDSPEIIELKIYTFNALYQKGIEEKVNTKYFKEIWTPSLELDLASGFLSYKEFSKFIKEYLTSKMKGRSTSDINYVWNRFNGMLFKDFQENISRFQTMLKLNQMLIEYRLLTFD